MALHQIALTKVHLHAWKRRGGGGAGPGLLLESLAQSEKIQCHLPSKTGKTFLALLPAGQRTPPPWACWQWHPRESTERARAQGSGCSQHPWQCWGDHAPSEQGRRSYESTTLKLLLLPWVLPPLSKAKGEGL